MKYRALILGAALAVAGCKDHSGKEEHLLDLGGKPTTSAAIPEAGITVDVPPVENGSTAPANLAAGVATPAAVLDIGRQYVQEAQAALLQSSVIDYCRVFASILVQPGDLRACIGLVAMPATTLQGLPTVGTLQQLVDTAARLPVVRRFAICTSQQALSFIVSFDDYDRCMPPSLQKELEGQLADLKFEILRDAGLGPPGFPYNDPLSTAAGLSQEYRVAYCAIPEVASELEGADKTHCIQGVNPNVPAMDSPSGQADPIVDPYAVLSNASQMRSQAERTALCNKPEVVAALTLSQHQACQVGLSPKNPPA